MIVLKRLVLDFGANLSLGVLIKFVLIKKKERYGCYRSVKAKNQLSIQDE